MSGKMFFGRGPLERAERPVVGARALATALLGAVLLTGCELGTDDSTSPVTFAVTDAPSDDLVSFRVELTGMRLLRLIGSEVGVLDNSVSVDFAALTELSEVLHVLDVPVGSYVAAEVDIDFTGAEAFLVGQTSPATILDGDGMPVTGVVTLPIVVGSGGLQIAAGRHSLLELDFDLDHSLVTDTVANEVRLEPTLILRVDRTDPRELVVAGDLVSVDAPGGEFVLKLRSPGGALGDVTLAGDSATLYQVDGTPALGAAGLSVLAGLPVGTWIQAYGAVDADRAAIDVTYVEAGGGTLHGGQDIVQGHVVGRTGGAGANAILTVHGYSRNAAGTAFQFNQDFTVSTSFTSTSVVRRGSGAAMTTDDLNVGQKVRVFGSLAGMTLDATATGDVVRMQPTRILGLATGAPSGGTLTVDVSRVGLVDEGDFLWSEGGTTPPDPDLFTTSVGSLTDGLGIMAGTAVEVRGFLAPYADAADDLVASAVTNRDDGPSGMLIHDRLGGQTVGLSTGPSSLTFSLSGSPGTGELALLDQGFVGTTPLPTSPSPVVQPHVLPLGIFLIRDRNSGGVSLFLSFTEFRTALDQVLTLGANVYNFGTAGQYDAGTNTMTSGLILVSVQ